MKSRLGDHQQKQRSTAAQDNQNKLNESVLKQQNSMKIIDKPDLRTIKSSLGSTLQQKYQQNIETNKKPMTITSSRQNAVLNSQSSFQQLNKQTKPNTQSIIVSSNKIPPSNSSIQSKFNAHTYNSNGNNNNTSSKQMINENKSRQSNNFSTSVLNSNNTTTTLNNTTHTKIANNNQSQMGSSSSIQHINFVKALKKGQSILSNVQSQAIIKSSSSSSQQSGVNSSTLAQKLQQLQQQQQKIMSLSPSKQVLTQNSSSVFQQQQQQYQQFDMKSNDSNSVLPILQTPQSSQKQISLKSSTFKMARNSNEKNSMLFSGMTNQDNSIIKDINGAQSPKLITNSNSNLIMGFPSNHKNDSQINHNYEHQTEETPKSTMTPTSFMNNQLSKILSNNKNSKYKHQHQHSQQFEMQQQQQNEQFQWQQQNPNIPSDVNTIMNESFKSENSTKSVKTTYLQPDYHHAKTEAVINPKRLSALGTQSNYYVRDNVTGRNPQILTTTSQDNAQTSSQNFVIGPSSTNSGRQRVRVKINPNKDHDGKKSNESSTSHITKSMINSKQPQIVTSNTPQSKLLNPQVLSKTLAVNQKYHQSQLMGISKTPSTKMMSVNNGDEPIQESQDLLQEQPTTTTYTSLLMQNSSTKQLLEKIGKKTQENQNQTTVQQNIPRYSLPLKLLTLPKKQSVAIKIDLGDSPNASDIPFLHSNSQSNQSLQQQQQQQQITNDQKPTILTNIGNKTIQLPSKTMINNSHNSNSFLNSNNHQKTPQSLIMNIDRDLSNADDDELRLSNQVTRQPSRQQLNSIMIGTKMQNPHHQLGGSLESKELIGLIENNGINISKTQLHKYGDRTQNLSKKNLLKSESKRNIKIEVEEEDEEPKKQRSPGLNLEDLQCEQSNQRFNTQEQYDQSIIQIQIEKVNEEYCLQQTRVNHSKKNTLFCQSAIVNDVVNGNRNNNNNGANHHHNTNTTNNNHQNYISVESPYQIAATITPNAQQNKKKALVKRFKYKNLTENQTPSSKSFLTDNKGETPQSGNTSMCGMSQYSASNTKNIPNQRHNSDINQFYQNGTQSTRNQQNFNNAHFSGNLYAPTFIHQDSSPSPDTAKSGGRLLRNTHINNFNSGNSPNQQIPTMNNNYYILPQKQQQNHQQQQLPHQIRAYKDTASTSSQQDIQNRIADVKNKLLTKTQIFRVDENRRISLPMRNTTQRVNSNSDSKQNNNNNGAAHYANEYANNTRQVQDHYGDTKSGIASADISDSGSVMTQQEFNSNQNCKYNMQSVNLNNRFQQEAVFERESTSAAVVAKVNIQNDMNFTGFQPNSVTGGGTFSAAPADNTNTNDNNQKQHKRQESTVANSSMNNGPGEKDQSDNTDNNLNSSHSSSYEEDVEHINVIEQEERLAASLPTIKGTLYKKIDNPKKIKNGKSYKKRYGLVRNKKFKYYKDKEMKELGGVFDFDRIQCVVMIDDGSTSNFQSMTDNDDSPSQNNKSNSSRYIEPKKFRIEVIGSKRNFLFHVQSSSALRQWTQALYANWHASKSFTLINSQNLINTLFWKSDMIALSNFRKLADTGDILLFTGSSFVTRVQRAITMSEYDHVAMLLRYSNGKLVMFESTGQTGVAVLDWDLFVKNNWNKLYTKLCFRKLRHNRTLETMQKLETFIRSVIGSKYKLNPTKIFRKKFENDSENVQDNDDKSYFCSELVASAYKCIGLLPKELSASQYWPGNFSSKSGLKLIGDAMLEDEQTIMFEE